MAKKIRFPLAMSDGTQARSLDELKEHFDLESVLGYYKSGKLLTWLRDRYIETEADAIEALDDSTPDFQQKLCGVFGAEFSGSGVDMEEIICRQERMKILRQFTDEDEFIQNIDAVAFDQEELIDLLDEGCERIYLCGEKFTVPTSQKNRTYVGINSPQVEISGSVGDDWEQRNITFINCESKDLPIAELSKEADIGDDADDISPDLADKIGIFMIRHRMHWIETKRYYVGSNSFDATVTPALYVIDKRTGENWCYTKNNTTGLIFGTLRVIDFEQDIFDSDAGQHIMRFNLPSKSPELIYTSSSEKEEIFASNRDYVIIRSNISYPGDIIAYHIETKRKHIICSDSGVHCFNNLCTNDALYLAGYGFLNDSFCDYIQKYDFDTKESTTITKLALGGVNDGSKMAIYKNDTLFWKYGNATSDVFYYANLHDKCTPIRIGNINPWNIYICHDGYLISSDGYEVYFLSFESKKLIKLADCEKRSDLFRLKDYVYFGKGKGYGKVSIDNPSIVELLEGEGLKIDPTSSQ